MTLGLVAQMDAGKEAASLRYVLGRTQDKLLSERERRELAEAERDEAREETKQLKQAWDESSVPSPCWRRP